MKQRIPWREWSSLTLSHTYNSLQNLPKPESLPSLPEQRHRWPRTLSPRCSHHTSSAPEGDWKKLCTLLLIANHFTISHLVAWQTQSEIPFRTQDGWRWLNNCGIPCFKLLYNRITGILKTSKLCWAKRAFCKYLDHRHMLIRLTLSPRWQTGQSNGVLAIQMHHALLKTHLYELV